MLLKVLEDGILTVKDNLIIRIFGISLYVHCMFTICSLYIHCMLLKVLEDGILTVKDNLIIRIFGIST